MKEEIKQVLDMLSSCQQFVGIFSYLKNYGN